MTKIICSKCGAIKELIMPGSCRIGLDPKEVCKKCGSEGSFEELEK